MTQVPSLGRAVIYTSSDKQEFAAVVTGTYEGEQELIRADLHVFRRNPVEPVLYVTGSFYDATGREPCSWRWPERR